MLHSTGDKDSVGGLSCVRSDRFVVSVNAAVLQDATPCTNVSDEPTTHTLYLQDKHSHFLYNVDIHLPNYKTSHPTVTYF
jgi:hypothetical protein